MLSKKLHINGSYTHEFHPYPAKFPPAVAKEIILKYTRERNTVLDPFCGSGTTIVEARLERRNAIGIELNPVGTLISQSKSEYYSKKHIDSLAEFLASHTLETLTSLTNGYRAEFPNINHWFSDVVIAELSTLKRVIEKCSCEKTQLILKTAFSRIILPVSNQDTETRYARVERKIPEGFTYSCFLKTCDNYLKCLTLSSRKPSPSNFSRIYEGDIAEVFPKVRSDSVELILTSPPYINSFDYYLYHKQRMHWLGVDPRRIRALEIGNHHRIDRMTFDEAVEEYRSDMSYFTEHSYRALRRGGYFAVLIGDGIVKGKVMRADKEIERLCQRLEFKLIEKKTLQLSSVSKTFIKEKARLAKKKHYTLVFQK